MNRELQNFVTSQIYHFVCRDGSALSRIVVLTASLRIALGNTRSSTQSTSISVQHQPLQLDTFFQGQSHEQLVYELTAVMVLKPLGSASKCLLNKLIYLLHGFANSLGK